MSATEEFFIGLASGVGATVLVAVVLLFFSRIMVPWYQQKIYRGVIVTGKWVGIQERGARGRFELELTISQSGHKVKGDLRSTDKYPEGTSFTRFYKVNGKVSDGWLLLTYDAEDRHRVGLGALLTNIRSAGDQMSGSIMFLKTQHNQASCDPDLTLNRTSGDG